MHARSGTTITTTDARRLLMGAQQLLANPERRATVSTVYRTIHAMGFVQLDTISAVERAHHHILHSRLDGYRPSHLQTLHHDRKLLFEQYTHDVSLIPTEWFAHWRYRHARASLNTWLRSRLGTNGEQVVASVRRHILEHGPCTSRELHPLRDDRNKANVNASAGWWEWKPHKAALEYLWRTGKLCVAERRGFCKVYDLAHRVLPEAHANETPPLKEHVDWACRTALDRLGLATPGELSAFWKLITPAQAAAWCKLAESHNEIVPALVQSDRGEKPRKCYAWPDIRRVISGLPSPPGRTRLLSPFDPVIRDRDRLRRLFNFDYTLEVFVPATKRKYGYYVLPILEGDRFIGRVDPKLHRDESLLEIQNIWWEPGVKPTKARRAALEEAIERYASFAGATRWTMTIQRA